MQSRRLVFSLLILGMGALLAACTTPTDGLLGSQGFGHFNAKSVNIDLGDGTSGFTAQVIAPTTTAPLVLASGMVAGQGSDTYEVRVTASGVPIASCRNGGQNRPPGQNPVSVTGLGDSDLTPTTKKGRLAFENVASTISTQALIDLFTPFPCPNENWTAFLDFVFWDYVKLDLIEKATGNIVDTLEYSCTTLRDPTPSMTCSPL